MAFVKLWVDSHACLCEEYCSSFQSSLKNNFTKGLLITLYFVYVFDYFYHLAEKLLYS